MPQQPVEQTPGYDAGAVMAQLLDHLEDDFDDTGPFAHDPSIEDTYTPIWREAIWPTEFMALHWHPLFWGWGVERGHDQPVLVIPGFIANDLIMLPMRQWLNRIGYRAHAANIHWNTSCPDQTASDLARQVESIHRRTGKKVILVGHSLGGMLAKTVMLKNPELIDRVITVGSPFRDIVEAHPLVLKVWDYLKIGKGDLVGRNLKASCGTGYCLCDFTQNMIAPAAVDVPQFAIYSRNDGIVGWQSCAEEDPSKNIEVNGASHMGLAFNIGSYRALAKRLAQKI